MATASGNFYPDNSSLANFKAWAQFISGAFSTFGWTQTSDTGQVNWTSIAAVPSSSYVYEIWKANDAQASTTPIYVKVEYGFSSTLVAIRMTVGTGSNGSGTINGTVSFNALVITRSNGTFSGSSVTQYPCFASGDAGEIRFLMWINNSSTDYATFFEIERSKDASGNKTTDYFTALYANAFANATTEAGQQTTLGLNITALSTQFLSCFPAGSSFTTSSFNGTVAAFPVFPFVGKLGNPMLGVMTCVAGDVADATVVTVASMYGGTHTYVSCKSGSGSGGFGRMGGLINGGSIGALLMRYE